MEEKDHPKDPEWVGFVKKQKNDPRILNEYYIHYPCPHIFIA